MQKLAFHTIFAAGWVCGFPTYMMSATVMPMIWKSSEDHRRQLRRPDRDVGRHIRGRQHVRWFGTDAEITAYHLTR